MIGKLTLERRLNESVVIEIDGREVEVIVSKIGESRIKLTFIADDEVAIIRKELALGPES